VDLAKFTLRKASLDEVFLGLTGGRGPGQGSDHGPAGDHGQADYDGPVGGQAHVGGQGHAGPQHDDELRELERSPR